MPDVVGKALDEAKISTSMPPQVNVTKFVPFSALEVEIVVDQIGEVKLADYKKINRSKPTVEVSKEDVANVTKRIQMDFAERKEVERKSKDGDQVWINFSGTDSDGKPVDGATGNDYPLALGSNTFIPGFEENLLDLAAGDSKTFTLTFPADYGVAALNN